MCVAVLALVAAGAASAQNFSGFYLGAYAGDSVDRSIVSTTTVFSETGYFASTSVTAINGVGTQAFPLNGITGGGRVGWNFRWGHFVFGPEVDFGTLRVDGSATATANYPCCGSTSFTIAQGIKTRGLFTARARAGVTFGPVLFYLTGGAAVTDINSQQVFTDTFANAMENGGPKVDSAGWVVGGGGELKLSRRWSITGEFLYISFSSVSNTSTNLVAFEEEDDGFVPSRISRTAGEPTTGESFPENVFTHSASLIERVGRFGINFHF
jgi:outer membrane immunogenic protein